MTANNLRLPTYKYDQNSAVMKKKKSRLFQKLATPHSWVSLPSFIGDLQLDALSLRVV
jgi:hypothetical protein